MNTWVSTDPATLVLGTSPASDALRTLAAFTYGRQNPLRYNDPNGADTVDSLIGFSMGAFNVVLITADMVLNSNGHAPGNDVEFNPASGIWSDNALDDNDFTRGVKIGKATAAAITIIGAVRLLRSGVEPATGGKVNPRDGGIRIPLDKLESPKSSISADARFESARQGVERGETPPIEVEPTGRGTFRIQDGVRRSVGARELGLPDIDAVIRQPTYGAPKTIPSRM